MKSEYRLTPQAREDVIAIWEYIAADNEDAADRLIDEITECINGWPACHMLGPTSPSYDRACRRFPRESM